MPLSEFELINRYFKNLVKDNSNVICGIGDDAAVLNVPEGKQLVSSIDTLVSGIHFFADAEPYDIGFKSLAVNLSDMAAMAAEPRWASLALTLPENNGVWLEKFAAGFSNIARQFGVSLIGGDFTRGPLTVTVQISGLVTTAGAVYRHGAQTDDMIYVSGCIGGAGLALKHLTGELKEISDIPDACLERLLRPVPRVELGKKLQGLATSAIDISDGLSADLGHVLRASARGAVIELDNVPLCKELKRLPDQDTLWQIALCSGDDYELCFTVAEENQKYLEQIADEVDCPLNCIGTIVEGNELTCLSANGKEYDLKQNGYQHF